MNLSALGLFLLLVGTVFVPPELFSFLTVVFLLIIISASSFRIPRDVIKFILPLIVIILVGLLSALRNPFYDVVKDVWYIGKPIALLMLGYMLMLRIRDVGLLVQIVLFASVIAACWHLSAFVLDPNLIRSAVPVIRQAAGPGYFLAAIAMAIAIGCLLPGARPIRFGKKTLAIILMLCGTSLVLSFSRTYWLSMAILSLAVLGALTDKLSDKRKLTLFLILLFAVVLGMFGSESIQYDSRMNMFGKIAHSIEEISVSDYATEEKINQNWRGYESYKAILTFTQGSALEQVIGRGLGALIDLGIHMQLSEITYRYIPILHNGYLYILVKAGLMGLLLYVWFLRRLLARARSLAKEQQPQETVFAGRMLAGLMWTFVFSTMVIAGVFNREVLHAATLIAGAFCAVQIRGAHSCERQS